MWRRRSGQRLPFSLSADNTLAAVPPPSGRGGRRGRGGRTGYPEGGGGGPRLRKRAVGLSFLPSRGRKAGSQRPPVGVEYEKSLYPRPSEDPLLLQGRLDPLKPHIDVALHVGPQPPDLSRRLVLLVEHLVLLIDHYVLLVDHLDLLI